MQYAGFEIHMPYARMAKNEDYERRLYRMLHCYRRQIDEGDFPQSTSHPSVDLVCFNYSFADSWLAHPMNQFHSLMDLKLCARKRWDLHGVFAAWYCVEIFANPPPRRPAF